MSRSEISSYSTRISQGILIPEKSGHEVLPFVGALSPFFTFPDFKTQKDFYDFDAGFLPLDAIQRDRLVKASKSPTQQKPARKPETKKPERNAPYFLDIAGEFSPLKNPDRERSAFAVENNGVGAETIIEHREWCSEFRIRTATNVAEKKNPPVQEGERKSSALSYRASRKIADSSDYVFKKLGGFQTFATATFKPEARERIASGETTIQKEISRLMDSLTKMYQRGWVTSGGIKVPGHTVVDESGKVKKLTIPYIWVIEIPENADGGLNPHVHMLWGWSVEYKYFQDWAERIESLWGQGTVHLEKLKKPSSAGSYICKAAGYLSKEDQGEVVGNRYFISKRARAPLWSVLGSYQFGVMGTLIYDLDQDIRQKYSGLYQERQKLNAIRSEEISKAKAEGRYWFDRSLESRLQAVRNTIAGLDIRTSKYQCVLKGDKAFARFWGWAVGNGWRPEKRSDSVWFSEYKRRRASRLNKSVFKSALAYVERVCDSVSDSLSAFEDYNTACANDALLTLEETKRYIVR